MDAVDKAKGSDGKPLNDSGKEFYPDWDKLSKVSWIFKCEQIIV